MPTHTLIKTPHDTLTYKIIGCAMACHTALGPGLREDTYHQDMEVRFTQCGLSYVSEQRLEVYDSVEGQALIGYYIPDFIVAEQVIVELKALPGLDNTHTSQVIGYLAVTDCPVGLLLNFGRSRLEYHRILPPADIAAHRVNRRWLWVPDYWKQPKG